MVWDKTNRQEDETAYPKVCIDSEILPLWVQDVE
jgi:hypothetical protein